MKPRQRSSQRTPKSSVKGKSSKNNQHTNDKPLIVGVGASAGGLQAFTQLLEHLPRDPGMALVLVQHLAPKHASALTELLGRTTPMPVAEVTDGMLLQNNRVYVIPPDHDMETRSSKLYLVPRATKRPHMPIDYFFNSLAEDHGNKAIGVIFSGTASDGTLGLKAIKAAGGITFAQDPEKAGHAEMPRNAIAAGCVDSVLPIDKIANELLRISHHPYVRLPVYEEVKEVQPKGENELARIYRILRGATGVDFTFYKSSTIRRRIRRRMMLLKLDTLRSYTAFLRDHRNEVDALFQDILIHVTGFFRDPEVFEALKAEIFPKLIKDRSPGTPLRMWVAGCSTGEEVYSLAIAVLEFLAESSAAHEIQIFATDVNNDALEKARTGEYLENIAAEVSQDRLRRFFVRMPHGYRVSKAVRDVCIFARHDICKDPPFSHLDLITCRNLLIYLGPPLQKRILPIFHYALKSAGYLLLGSSETIGSFAEYFSLMDKKHKLYIKKPTPQPPIIDFGGRPYFNVALPGGHGHGEMGADFDLQKEAERILLNRYSPPGVIINDDFQILHFRGRTGRYLEPAPGQASLNLAKMAREGLSVDLRAAVQEARKHAHAVKKQGVHMRRNAHVIEVDFDVVPIKGPIASARYFLVLFRDAAPATSAEAGKGGKGRAVRNPASRVADHEITRLKDELAQNKGTLQSTIEELEATNEELRSANEEILSSNEELQSTNEELETAKEELQSANEELSTLNDELQNRNNELSTANNDLVNLLGAINIPILMLGDDLRIRRFTPATQKLMNLIPSDVGRPLSDVKLNFDLPGFEKIVAEAVDSVMVRDFEVRDGKGRWYSMRIRPYKTAESKIEGAVISWIEVTGLKEALDETTERARFLFERNLAGIFYMRDGRVLDCNGAFAHILGYSSRKEAMQAENIDAHLTRSEQEGLLNRLMRQKGLNNEEITVKRKDGSQAWLVASASQMEDGGTLGIAVDISRQVEAEKKLTNLSRTLMKQADERRRTLARDLHDQVGSQLGGLTAMLGALEDTPGLKKEVRSGLKKCLQVVHDTASQVRTVSHLQHPMIIDEMGLGAAARSLAEEFSNRCGIEIRVNISKRVERLPGRVEIALYRVIQECLTNIQRYSETQRANIRINLKEGDLVAEIRDFGKGFAPQQEGLGIMGMRERMKELGGRLEIESGKKGTTVRALLPLSSLQIST